MIPCCFLHDQQPACWSTPARPPSSLPAAVLRNAVIQFFSLTGLTTAITLWLVQQSALHVPHLLFFSSVTDFLREDTMIGTSFLRVAAHDDDFGTNAAITYSMSGEQPEYLRVNPLTGWVYVNQPISQVEEYLWVKRNSYIHWNNDTMEESFIDTLLTLFGQKCCFDYIRYLKVKQLGQMCFIVAQPGGPLHIRARAGCLCPTEDIHHQGNRGHRRRQQEQLSGAFCHHHQREEPASAVGRGQLHRGHTRKHRPRHPRGGTYGWGWGRRGTQKVRFECPTELLLWLLTSWCQ